ncbi:MAG: C40 family peptidase, partial [Marinobacter sp.]
PVSAGDLQPGDLVFFEVSGKEQHAGIFMGGEHFIHASTSVGVTRSSLNGYYWRDRFTRARRFD